MPVTDENKIGDLIREVDDNLNKRVLGSLLAKATAQKSKDVIVNQIVQGSILQPKAFEEVAAYFMAPFRIIPGEGVKPRGGEVEIFPATIPWEPLTESTIRRKAQKVKSGEAQHIEEMLMETESLLESIDTKFNGTEYEAGIIDTGAINWKGVPVLKYAWAQEFGVIGGMAGFIPPRSFLRKAFDILANEGEYDNIIAGWFSDILRMAGIT